jgi:hypothetical protein
MNYYAKLIIIVLLLVGISQVAPEAINWLLLLILASVFVLQAGQFAKLIQALKL